MSEERTRFDYLLNALLHAAQADRPAEHGYRAKTLALFAYVRRLERIEKAARDVAGSDYTNPVQMGIVVTSLRAALGDGKP